jgi:hypothetical protein
VKKLLTMVLFIVLFSGCNTPPPEEEDYLEATIEGHVLQVKYPNAYFYERINDDGMKYTGIYAHSDNAPGHELEISYEGEIREGSFSIGLDYRTMAFYANDVGDYCICPHGFLNIYEKTDTRLKGGFSFFNHGDDLAEKLVCFHETNDEVDDYIEIDVTEGIFDLKREEID